MNEDLSPREPDPAPPAAAPRSRRVLWIVLATVVATLAAVWLVRMFLFPDAFRPVALSAREQSVLNGKLRQIGVEVADEAPGALEPEPYSEVGASREIAFTEREINALLARNTDLAEKLAIDLSENLASARLLLPLDPDFPVLGGQTLRIHAGLELSYLNARPVVILRGVSVMGVPIPDAWLGNLKNIDLVEEFGNGRGFWQGFAAGVEAIEVHDGRLRIQLKE
jgi:hypothetical protein